MKPKHTLFRKAISLLLCLLLLSGTFAFLDFGDIKVKAASVSYWDGSSETPNTDDFNRVYPNDLLKTNENGVDVLHIKSARGLMLYANVVKNKGWFHEWYLKLDTDIDLSAGSWMGIGNNGNNVFTGTFDGQGHTIYNMTISDTGNDIGFIRKANGATVKNINFDNCTVSTGDMSGLSHGVVVGWCNQTTCYFENITVTRSKVYGDCYLGGIVGAADATIVLSNCRNLYTADYASRVCTGRDYFVKGNDGNTTDSGVGGLVGRVSTGCKLTMNNCVNSVYVSITGGNNQSYRIGGLVGKATDNSNFKGCINYGTVGDPNDRKGLTAGIAGNIDGVVTAENCRNYGAVSGSDRVAGIVAWIGNSNDQNNYFINCSNNGVISATSEQAGGIVALIESNGVADFTDCNNYANVTATRHAAGIISILYGDLNCTRCTNSATISTTSDIYAAGICSYVDDDTFKFTDCTNSGSIFCGSDGNRKDACAGILAHYNGAYQGDKTFEFIRCKNTGNLTAASRTGGIAGYIAENNNPNVTFTECKNTGNIASAGYECGGIVGNLDSNGALIFDNCSNEGTINAASNFVGGIAGRCKGFVTAKKTTNTGNILGSGNVAGLIGWIQDDPSTFTDCANRGRITGSSSACAGLIGSFDGDSSLTITNCENRGNVSSSGHSVAGLIGRTYGAVIMNKGMNTGDITVSGDFENTAGIVGWIDDDVSTISNTFNYGSVTGRRRVGGIVGGMGGRTLELTNCGNLGNLTTAMNSSNTYAGGMIGYFNGTSVTLNECYNGNGTSGNIGSEINRFSRSGGLIGYATAVEINDCYNNADIMSRNISDSYVGGLVGEIANSDSIIRNSYNAGNLEGYTDGSHAGTLTGGNNIASESDKIFYLSNTYSGNFRLQGSLVTDEELKSERMVSGNLNNGKWDVDRDNINTGYPVLKSSVVFTQVITFKDYDGSVLESREWPYGMIPSYSGEATPSRESDETYHYVFNNKWTPEIVAAKDDTVYTAVFTAEKHTFKYVSISDTHHHYVCSECGYIKASSEEPHVIKWVNGNEIGHKQRCQECGYEGAYTAHRFEYSSSKYQHWQVCQDCGYQANTADHIYKTANDGSQHWQECTVCAYKATAVNHTLKYNKDSDVHWQYCTGCDFIAESIPHELTYSSSQKNHWLKCNECGFEEAKTAHSLITDYDETSHWTYCNVCDFTSTPVQHNLSYGNDSEYHWQYCSDCDYSSYADPHNLVYKTDKYDHQQICDECGMTFGEPSPHVFTNGKTCDVCGIENPGMIMGLNVSIDYRNWTKFETNESTRDAQNQLYSVIEIASADKAMYSVDESSVALYLTLTNGYSYSANVLSERELGDSSIAGNYLRFDLTPSSGLTFADMDRMTSNIKVIGNNGEELNLTITVAKVSQRNTLRVTIKNEDTGAVVTPHTHSSAILINGQEPTENVDGWMDYYKCQHCISIFEDSDLTTPIDNLEEWKTGDGKLEALGHVYIEEITTKPTCTEPGVKTFTCKFCSDTYTESIDPTGHSFGDWYVAELPTTDADGLSERECAVCHDKETRILERKLTNCIVNGNLVYGLSAGLLKDGFIENNLIDNDVQATVTASSGNVMGTGSTVTVTYETGEVIEYKLVIFGDVNGDGWYDGMDAFITGLISDGMLTQDDVSEAEYAAADCNHDGVIDELDVDILRQAGVMLAQVEQTEDIESSSVYAEYIAMIDQNPSDSTAGDTEYEPSPFPEYNLTPIEKVIVFIMSIWKFIISIFKF